MNNKKTKLTISGNPKKSFQNFGSSKNQSKKTVVIDKQRNKPFSKTFGSKPLSGNYKKNVSIKPNFSSKTPPVTSDFERRKLAEQRATKRLKGDADGKEKKR